MSLHDNQPILETGSDSVPSRRESSDKEQEKLPSQSSVPKSEEPPKSPFPDGGTKAWLTVLGAWCCFFSSYGFVTSIGVFQGFYEENYLHEYSSSSIAWILSIQAFLVSAAAPFAGPTFDRQGPRLLIGVGSLLIVLGLMTLSVSREYYQIFLSQSISSGLGMGMIFHGCVNSVSTWFLKKRGLALGISSSGAGVGGVLIPIIFDRLVVQIGFPWTVRVLGFIILGLQIVAFLTVRSRLDHKGRPPFRITMFAKPFRDRAFVLDALAGFFGFLGTLIPFNYLKLASQSAGVSPNLATYLLPLINASTIIGRVIPLWAGDHVGAFNTIAFLMLYGAVLILALWLPGAANQNAIISFSVLFGVPLGCFNAVIPALVAKISRIEEIGFRVGTTFFVCSFASLIGNPIAGSLIGKGSGWAEGPQSYNALKLFCGLSIAISGLLYTATRVQIGGTALKKKV
ncbi:major facilitator superfamily domain-containing protein [Xylariaceae sp. FL1272]|nr:major facilitator superfamily domain-containing protein [Xylariaceae sp. FL1272]